MVRKQSAVKTGKKINAEASTRQASMEIPFTINTKNPHFWRMNFLPERGYEMTNAHPSFESTIQNLNWESFVQHRTYYLEQIVREFYAGMHTNAGDILPDHSMVRGTKVFFDEQTINEHYHLRYSGDSFDEKIESYGKKKMEQVRTRICVPNAEWEKFSQNEFKMKIRYIIPELSNWHTFINCSIMPTSHNYTLTKDRMIVLDCILLEEEINIGKIINREIRDCADKKEGFLFFPCLITALCIKQNVSISETERTYRRKPPNALSAQMKARRVYKDPEELGKKTMKKKLKHEVLEQEDAKEQEMLKFFHDQHEWIKKRFAEISQAPSSLEIPEFPKWLIKEDEKELEEEESEEEGEVVEKKKKSLKRKKETQRKGREKKKEKEVEWIDVESTEEEEDQNLKEMEKETDEEDDDTATDGSDSVKEVDDFDLGLSLEEMLRKKKAKSPVLVETATSEKSPRKSPSPLTAEQNLEEMLRQTRPTVTIQIPVQSSTSPSTGTTPPPPKKDTSVKADVTQEETETEKQTNKKPIPPPDQTTEKAPPTEAETPIILTNIVSETGTLQEDPTDATTETVEETENAAMPEKEVTEASAPDVSAPKQQPTVIKTVIGNIDETLNVVVTELAEKKRQDLGNTQKFFKKSTSAVPDKETKEVQASEAVEKDVSMEESKAKQASKESTQKEEATMKDVAELLADLPDTVMEQPAKTTEDQSSAQATDASAPAFEKPTETAALQTPASGSKTPKSKKQKKPKPTPTRSSNRIRSGAKPQ